MDRRRRRSSGFAERGRRRKKANPLREGGSLPSSLPSFAFSGERSQSVTIQRGDFGGNGRSAGFRSNLPLEWQIWTFRTRKCIILCKRLSETRAGGIRVTSKSQICTAEYIEVSVGMASRKRLKWSIFFEEHKPVRIEISR